MQLRYSLLHVLVQWDLQRLHQSWWELGVVLKWVFYSVKGEALQLLKETKVVAVDKTGTLTEGKPILTDLHVLEGFKYNAVLSLMAAVESKS